MKDQIFIATVGILFCYGILLLTIDLKNYCEYATTNNKFYSEKSNSNKTDEDFQIICSEVQKEYVKNQVYDKFLNNFYNYFSAKNQSEYEVIQFIQSNTYSHLKMSSSILKLTKCCLYCLGLFVAIMIVPNIFFYLMKAFLKKILVYIFIMFIVEAISSFYFNYYFDVLRILKMLDYYDLRTKIVEGALAYYWDIVKQYVF